MTALNSAIRRMLERSGAASQEQRLRVYAQVIERAEVGLRQQGMTPEQIAASPNIQGVYQAIEAVEGEFEQAGAAVPAEPASPQPVQAETPAVSAAPAVPNTSEFEPQPVPRPGPMSLDRPVDVSIDQFSPPLGSDDQASLSVDALEGYPNTDPMALENAHGSSGSGRFWGGLFVGVIISSLAAFGAAWQFGLLDDRGRLTAAPPVEQPASDVASIAISRAELARAREQMEELRVAMSLMEDQLQNGPRPDSPLLAQPRRFLNWNSIFPGIHQSLSAGSKRAGAGLVRYDAGAYKILFRSPLCALVANEYPEMVDPRREGDDPDTLCQWFGVWNEPARMF